MRRPLVSVIIPTYNRADLISQTIDNVFGQTYDNFEVVVVDDGSSDDTAARLRTYGDRIRVITQGNAGPAVARNRGVAAAHGEIIAFQDSDDFWKAGKLDRQVALLLRFGTCVPCCLCNADMGTVNGQSLTSFDHSQLRTRHQEGLWLNVTEVLATRFVLFNQAVAMHRSAFERAGGFDENLKYLEDYDLPMRLSLDGPWAFIREPLVMYSGTREGSFSHQALKDPLTLKQCELAIFERILKRVEGDKRHSVAAGYIRRRLKAFRRGVTEIHLATMGYPGANLAGTILRTVRHYQDAFFRRSPWYPKMRTEAGDQAGS